jgi:O-acetyl-ADP-ribose deacetylase
VTGADPLAGALARIEILHGDLVEQDVDALVNAANEALAGGGGVDGAIHRAAGPELLAACARLHPRGCPTGEARITPGFRLRARHVIHTVGPVWRGGAHGETALLARCHRSALELAAAHGLASIALPAISTGAFGYPAGAASGVALAATAAAWSGLPALATVRFVLFREELRALFEATRAGLLAARGNPGGARS